MSSIGERFTRIKGGKPVSNVASWANLMENISCIGFAFIKCNQVVHKGRTVTFGSGSRAYKTSDGLMFEPKMIIGVPDDILHGESSKISDLDTKVIKGLEHQIDLNKSGHLAYPLISEANYSGLRRAVLLHSGYSTSSSELIYVTNYRNPGDYELAKGVSVEVVMIGGEGPYMAFNLTE